MPVDRPLCPAFYGSYVVCFASFYDLTLERDYSGWEMRDFGYVVKEKNTQRKSHKRRDVYGTFLFWCGVTTE